LEGGCTEKAHIPEICDLAVQPTLQRRGLGIPVIADRALQAHAVNALEPEWEARFEPKSYGFRPGRGCHDAIGAIFQTCKGPMARRVWALDADLAAALDPWSYCSFAHCAC